MEDEIFTGKYAEEDEAGLPKMAEEGIHAGFPSPAENYMTGGIDLNRELVRHPAATFYARVVGDSMIGAGVSEGDILVIDRSLEAREGDMAVCFIDGEFTLKYLSFSDPEGGSSGAGHFAVKDSGAAASVPSDAVSSGGPSSCAAGGGAGCSKGDSLWLVPANPAYRPMKVTVENDFTLWGVVTYVIKNVRSR